MTTEQDRSGAKLPPYEELKRLYLDERLSFQQIADRYGVARRQTVHKVLRDRASARGEWPLPRPPRLEISRKLPSYAVLKRLYVVDGLSFQQIADRYGVSSKQAVHHTLRRRAVARGEWPLVPHHAAGDKIRREQQARGRTVDGRVLWDLATEFLAENGLTLADLAERAGLPVRYVQERDRSRRAGSLRLRADYAVRIMEAIGEPVPDWMRAA